MASATANTNFVLFVVIDVHSFERTFHKAIAFLLDVVLSEPRASAPLNACNAAPVFPGKL